MENNIDFRATIVVIMIGLWLIGGLMTVGSLVLGGESKVNLGGGRGYLSDYNTY